MSDLSFETVQLKKVFDRTLVFANINITLKLSQSLVVTGRNGSGKSTLLKILAGVLQPTEGKVQLKIDGKLIPSKYHFQYIGFVSPYLQLYDEFSAWEHLTLFSKIRGIKISNSYIYNILQMTGLSERIHDNVRSFSSGMKQRLKISCALVHNPAVLILDEPTSNLDSQGTQMVSDIIQYQKERGIVVVAVNELEDEKWFDQLINLELLRVNSCGK